MVGRIVVDDLGAPSVTAALAGGRLAFQGLFPDALALGLDHAREEREQVGAAPGRVVDPLEGADETVVGFVAAFGTAASPPHARPGPGPEGVFTSSSARSWRAPA
ncbi:hypothetical protein ACGFR8_35615 [Streptomyces brevispora]|uniref:hypothetical protein n=1 Tax=Streptomyces brevispora TaxID=887462 RepID=UPI00372039FE